MKKQNLARSVAMLSMAILFLGFSARAQQGPPPPPPPPPAPAQVTIGILPFPDLSGNSDLGQLGTVLPALMQTALANRDKLMPREIQPGASAPGAGPQVVNSTYAIQLGQYYGTNLVLAGSILSGQIETKQGSFNGGSLGGFQLGGSSNSQSATVTLQVDLIDVGRSKDLGTFRATGKDRETHIDPNVNSNYGNMNMQSTQFQNTSLGKATNRAIAELTRQVLAALRNYKPAPQAAAAALPPAVVQQPGAGAQGQAVAGTSQPASPATNGNQNRPSSQPQNTALNSGGNNPAGNQNQGAPQNSAASSGTAAGASKCTLEFRVMLLSDMSLIRSGYTLAANGRDVTSQISSGVFRLQNVPSQLDLHVHFASSPVKAGQPADYDNTSGFSCDTPSVTRLVLTIDSNGTGNFNFMN